MNAMEARERRKQMTISVIEESIAQWIVKNNWTSIIVLCNSDLYEDIKAHFESKGYKMWREEFNIPDMDGCPTSDYGYHTYIGV